MVTVRKKLHFEATIKFSVTYSFIMKICSVPINLTDQASERQCIYKWYITKNENKTDKQTYLPCHRFFFLQRIHDII